MHGICISESVTVNSQYKAQRAATVREASIIRLKNKKNNSIKEKATKLAMAKSTTVFGAFLKTK